MGRVVKQLKHSWNAFTAPAEPGFAAGASMGHRQARSPARYFNDRSIVGSIYTRLAVDLASVTFYHAKLDDNGVAIDVIKDSLNDRLTLDANIDQSSQALFIDWAMTLFEQGTSCMVPIEMTLDPAKTTSYDIKSMRVGRAVGWEPRKIRAEVYDDRDADADGNPINGGIVKQILLPKDQVAIVENPFYGVMNEPSGTFQRLQTKLSLLDTVDEAAGSGKLDMLLQLPYTVRGDSRRKQAKDRREDLAAQLKDDELGIGYIDISEKVIQLNRPIENKLLEQIEYLAKQLYAELGLTQEIMNGTASRDAINNYYDRTIEPIANALAQEMSRKFLTKTARAQGHSIEIYRDPLKLIPIDELAEIVDKLSRNAVITANEIRPKIGYRPSKEPGANMLMNPNMPADDQKAAPAPPPEEVSNDGPPRPPDQGGQ